MSLEFPTPSDGLRTRFAHALGFHEYPSKAIANPYLAYVIKTYSGEDIEGYLELFIEVVVHFESQAGGDDSIQALMDKLSLSGFRDTFLDTSAESSLRKEHVEDTVMCIVGTWATMLSSFQLRCQSRKVTAAYNIFLDALYSSSTPYEENAASLIRRSELLPGGQWDHRMDFGSDAALKLMTLLSKTTNPSIPSSMQNLLMQSTGQLHAPPNSEF